MASPFAVFRKHQKILIATLGLLAMIAFVFLPMFLKNLDNGGARKDPVVVRSDYGDLTESQLQNMRQRRLTVKNFLQRAVAAAAFDNQATYMRSMIIERFFGGVGEESTVSRWLVVNRAKQLGMTISDAAISDFIGGITDNRVTNEQFAHLYETMRLPEDIIFNTLHDELLAREYQEAFLTSLGGATPAQRWDYFQRLNRKVNIEVAAVPVADYLNQVEDPGDEVLKEFFDEHKGDLPSPFSPKPGFRIPVRAAIEYVKADMSKLADLSLPTDEEIEEYYMKHRDEKFLKPQLPGLEDDSKNDLPDSESTENQEPVEPKQDNESSEDKKTSARDSSSPFRLVSMADEKAEDTSADSPEETKPVDDSKYRSLADVRDEIRNILVSEKQAAVSKAADEVKKAMQPIRGAVDKYRKAFSLYKANPDADAAEPELPDYAALAKEQGFTYGKTGLIPAAEMGDLDIGRSMVDGGQTFLEYIYTTTSFNRPRNSHDIDQNLYLFWKTKSSDEEVPKFEDEGVREKVLAAWKLTKAREIALQEADKLADEARQSKKTLAEAVGSTRPVEKSGPFTWLSIAPAQNAQEQPRLVVNRVEHVNMPGEKFMSMVYGLGDGEIGVAMNYPEDVVYVAQLEDTEPSETVLWIQFRDNPDSFYSAAGRSDQEKILQAWRKDIRDSAGLKWERKPIPPVRRSR